MLGLDGPILRSTDSRLGENDGTGGERRHDRCGRHHEFDLAQEHGYQDRQKNPGQIQMRQRDLDVRRHYSKLIYEAIQRPVTLRLDRQLIKKRQGIQRDNEIVDKRSAEARLVIANLLIG